MKTKIFIEIPTWLGDAIMATPAIENIISIYKDCELTIFSSFVSTKLFKYHPNVKNIIIDDSKKEGNRYLNLYRLAKKVEKVDLAFSFRKNFTTKFLLFFINANQKFIYKRYTTKQRHQVLRYNDFINKSLSLTNKANDLKIYIQSKETNEREKPLLGINPGATYGSAKRWYPQEFAKVAIKLANDYDIVIFGGNGETQIANDIENLLIESNIINYKNLAGKTSVEELINNIANLNLFITNDSGPMHLAAAFKIPTVSIFGPTRSIETCQWNNPFNMLIKKDFTCMPCMDRECKLVGDENHQCMKAIVADDILDKIYSEIISDTIKKKLLQKEFKKKYNLTNDTKLVLFKANNFKQNGIYDFLEIILRLQSKNFKAIISGDDSQLKLAKKEVKNLQIEDKVILLNNISIKTCDIFILPTKNKKFANNILKAMEFKCVVFAPRENEATKKLLDVFATMDTPSDSNTPHKVDAILRNSDDLKLIQKQNRTIATNYISTQ